jgi:hypothetical protein
MIIYGATWIYGTQVSISVNDPDLSGEMPPTVLIKGEWVL